MTLIRENIFEDAACRNLASVFADRSEAGRRLAELLADEVTAESIILAIPAGGVPVAESLAVHLDLPWDVLVVSKITLQWNSEVGCGAVAFDGSVQWNDALLGQLALSPKQLEKNLARTWAKVDRRHRDYRGGQPPLNLTDRRAILVDDGLASGLTMELAIRTARRLGAARVTAAVPTAPMTTARRLSHRADAVVCVNLREPYPFAVADAYRNWRDVSEAEVKNILCRHAEKEG